MHIVGQTLFFYLGSSFFFPFFNKINAGMVNKVEPFCTKSDVFVSWQTLECLYQSRKLYKSDISVDFCCYCICFCVFFCVNVDFQNLVSTFYKRTEKSCQYTFKKVCKKYCHKSNYVNGKLALAQLQNMFCRLNIHEFVTCVNKNCRKR